MIVGTAGHIDHGKTALVEALTGVQTDRLIEERKRGITIDLGFAYAMLPNGSSLAFVDVPGHARFMRNMVAGASGIDLVLLVVAANDGIMPQTREHLAVLELLGVRRALVAITKCDLVDASRIEEVSCQLRDLLAEGPLAQSELFRVSSLTGQGIQELRARLYEVCVPSISPEDLPLRFAIDRSFTLPGAGTVITGFIAAGRVHVGGQFMVSPSGLHVRVRSLRANDRVVTCAGPGTRCGIALGGRISSVAIRRGDWLVDPQLHAPTARIDAKLRLLTGEPRALRHWTAVRIHHGAAQVGAHIALLQDEQLRPGEKGHVQMVFNRPISATVGDPFIVRSQDGSRTIGGGKMIDLSPPARRRRHSLRLAQFQAMAITDPADSLAAQLETWPWFVEKESFFRARGLGGEEKDLVLSAVPHHCAGFGQVTYMFGERFWKSLEESVSERVRRFHEKHPQLMGCSLQNLMAAPEFRMPQNLAPAIAAELVARGKLILEGGVYRALDHRLGLDRIDDVLWRRIRPLLEGDARFRPPSVDLLARQLRERSFDVRRVLKAMAKQGAAVEITRDQFFLTESLLEFARILSLAAQDAQSKQEGGVRVCQVRDQLKNGRKTTIKLLEHFDRFGITFRRGDVRVIDQQRLQQFASEGHSMHK